MEFKGMMGGLYKISEWIMRLSITNLLWIGCSIPFIFVAISIFIVPVQTVEENSINQLKTGILLLSILAPFTVIPATAALFSIARKWVMGDEDVPIFKTFFRGYKQNYLQSMLGGIIFIILGIVLFINTQFYGTTIKSLGFLVYLFIVLFIFLIAAFFNFLSITVHFQMKLFTMLKNSIFLTLGNPIQSIGILAINALILYISLFKFTFLIPFFTGSLIAVATFWQFNRNLQKIQSKIEKKNLEQQNSEDPTKS